MSAQDNEWLTAAVRVEIGYEVITNTDTTEGRGRNYTLGVCSNESAAKALAKGQGVMGSNAEVRRTTFLRVQYNDHSGDLQDFYVMKSQDVTEHFDPEAEEREAALAKLTDREKELLGIS